VILKHAYAFVNFDYEIYKMHLQIKSVLESLALKAEFNLIY
jgi:hypothetical protein